MFDHKIMLVSKKVQLAIKLIDDYTDEMIFRDIKVYIKGQRKAPIINKSGYFVFTEIEGAIEFLVIKSKYFFEEVINLNNYKEEQLLVFRLIPNTMYPFPSKATLIRGSVSKGTQLKIKAISKDMAYARLIKPSSRNDDEVNIVKIGGKTHENMLYNIMSTSNEYDEFCIICEHLKGKGIYKLKSNLLNDYEKGALLLHAKDIRVDERKQFTVYFSQLMSLECKFVICFENQMKEVIVKEGNTLNVGLIN